MISSAEWTEEEACKQFPGTLSVHISVLAIFRILAKTATLTANRNVLPAQETNPIPDSSAPVLARLLFDPAEVKFPNLKPDLALGPNSVGIPCSRVGWQDGSPDLAIPSISIISIISNPEI
ncbi:hypothetical protein VM1G_10863 [Cytospora mali]|uniref:Uncharacterized protein n=1 Tax=Cytospora mali TaxID=578113 RepID=A0A194VJA4_CYTMA|nr:hypothetical protein VM1G_10863 [Valsa mali]